MADLTFDDLELKEEQVKLLLDEPAQKFLKSQTIQALQRRAYNLVAFQIEIVSGNQVNVIDAINAIAACWSFGAYGNSISNSLQMQDIDAYRANLEHYCDTSKMLAAQVGVNLDPEVTATMSDPIPYINTGRSDLDVTEGS